MENKDQTAGRHPEMETNDTGNVIAWRTKRPVLGSTVFLYVTEFMSGMAVMAAELGASRLLAPYFSSSQIVWTIIIGTIMIALALGTVWGGKQADAHPDPDRLYARIAVAAVWIAFIPLIGRYLIIAISGLLMLVSTSGFLPLAAFISCLLVFAPPLFILGSVSPALIKLTTDSLERNASVAGRLSACNTIGSILGTFLPTFVTIPAFGTMITFMLFAGLLLAIPAVYFFVSHARRVFAAVCTGCFVLACVLSPFTGFAFWEHGLAYEGESMYNYLQVRETADRTVLSTNVLFGVQSVTTKRPGPTGMYYDTALAAAAMTPHHRQALILGMGTGTYARQLARYYPTMKVTGVEIDAKITRLARQYFDEPADADVHEADGRVWLAHDNAKYDLIMVDAYQDITIPFHMSTVEFFSQVKAHLNKDGVMVVNMNMVDDGERSINASLVSTAARVFGRNAIAQADVPDNTNRELFAVNSDDNSASANPETLLYRASATLPEARHGSELAVMDNATLDTIHQLSARDARAGLVLTDDRAPVELLGIKAIDRLIEQQAAPYREQLRTGGISGLLDMMD